ncbi:MAG: MerR family transcriptional regulator [Chitinophagaceae bacterium]|jgi:DNA-binding transcriptional MerR regulator|nr:MerR family transcriptional regulator [Chitinophagaceae bacterium]
MMQKPFTQITFDFSAQETEKDEKTLFNSGEEISTAEHEMETDLKNDLQPEKIKPAQSRGRRSLKDNGTDDLIQIPTDEILFQKLYYPIGEVAEMFRVNQSLLRYWEAEFDILKPKKNGKGDRFFRPQDIKYLQLIYDLLRRRKFTIEGAKTFLKNNKQLDDQFDMIRSLEKIRSFLLELKASL